MKTTAVHFITSLLAALLLTPLAHAQVGDWSLVEQIQPGDRISVKAHHRITCVLDEIDDQSLACRIETPRWFGSAPEAVFKRSDVREVRLEHDDKFHAAIGTLAGAAVGGALGATRTSSDPVVGGLLLGSIGGVIGHFFGPIFPVIHGRVVYRR